MIPILISADYDAYSILDSGKNTATDTSGNTPIIRNTAESLPNNNGIGSLSDCIECYTESELNGGYELMMRYPADGIHADGIANRNIIMAVNEKTGELQPYRIYRVSKPINGIYTVYARHIVQTDLIGIPVKPFKSTNVVSAMQNMNDRAMLATGFTFTTNKGTFANMEIYKPTPLLSVLGGIEGSVLDVYGGEYRYDGKTVSLLDRVGADNGVRIAYGVNLTNFEQDANIQDCYTGAVGYWSNDEATVHTDVVSAQGTFDHVRIATVDLTDKFENKPEKEQLESALRSYMVSNGIGVPKVSINLSFVDLSQTTEYASIAQSVNLGDTVHVSFPKIGVDASARVVKTRWNVLLDRYDNIDIGSIKSNIADTISKQTRQIADAPTRKTAAAIASSVTAAILGASGGAVRLIDTDDDGMPDELYIADNPDPDLAQKVWRYNYEGKAASENGYGGPFESAETFGEILLGGGGNKSGTICILDESGNTVGKIDNGGFKVYDGDGNLVAILCKARFNNVNTGLLSLYGVHGHPTISANGDIGSVTAKSISVFHFNDDETSAGGGVHIVGKTGTVTLHNADDLENIRISGRDNTLEMYEIVPGGGHQRIRIDGNTGRIDCKELWVNGRQIT